MKNLAQAEYPIEPIKREDFSRLDGTYNNRQEIVFGQIVHMPYRGMNENDRILLDRLFVNFPDKAYEKDVELKIEFTSCRKATVTAYQNGQIFLTKNIRGKFKKGYFYVRPKVFVIPFFPVFYWHNFERVRLGKVGDDLVVDHTLRSWGFALFAGGLDKGCSTSIYKRQRE